jgi:hypothetical protein
MDTQLIAFLALCAVAAAAGAAGLLNLGADRVREASALDRPPDVLSTPLSIAIAVGVGLPTGLLLGLLVTPMLGVLGLGLGFAVALAWRDVRLGRWQGAVTRDMQTLVAILIIQLQSGGDSLYRALQVVTSRANLGVLGPVLDEHVLARVAAGAPLGSALGELARCRLLRDVPITQDALARLADLAGRDVPVDALLEALRIMDGTLTDIVRLEQEQAALSAQTRYSIYAVAGLEVAMAAVIIFVARSLSDALLHTLPGNVTLLMVCLAVVGAIYGVRRLSTTRPLRF